MIPKQEQRRDIAINLQQNSPPQPTSQLEHRQQQELVFQPQFSGKVVSPNGSASPLQSGLIESQVSVITNNLGPDTMQSAEVITSLKPFVNFRTQSNSSMISGDGSSYNHGYSPMKHGTSVIDKFANKKDIRTMQKSVEPSDGERLKLYGKRKVPQKIAISIKRRGNEVGQNTAGESGQKFMPQPTTGAKDARLATTQMTLTSVKTQEASNFNELNSILSRENMPFKSRLNHHMPQKLSTMANSLQFDQIRYGTNISNFSSNEHTVLNQSSVIFKNATSKSRVLTIPRGSQLSHDKSGDDSMEEIVLETHHKALKTFHNNSLASTIKGQKNKMAMTMISGQGVFESATKSTSPNEGVQNSSKPEFTCRFKELTWNQKPPGAVPLQINLGPPFSKRRTRPHISKRSSEISKNRRRNGQISQLGKQTEAQLVKPQNQDLIELPQIGLKQSAGPIKGKQSLLRTRQSKMPKRYEHRVVYNTIEGSTQPSQQVFPLSNVTSRRNSKQGNLNTSQFELFQTPAKLVETTQVSTQMGTQQSREDGVFEVAIGGKTGASIFYDATQARHDRDREFDQLYGAMKGRKFRTGASVEITYARTMDHTRRFLHPQLRDLVKKQYSMQVQQAQLSSRRAESTVAVNNIRAPRHHSQYPSKRAVSQLPITSQSFGFKPQTAEPAQHILIEQSSDAPDQLTETRRASLVQPSLPEASKDFQASVLEEIQERDNEVQDDWPRTPLDNQREYQLSLETESRQLSGQQPGDYGSHEGKIDQVEAAFKRFKSLGGTFFNQKERQIITMDNNGGLHYEQKRADFCQTLTTEKQKSIKQMGLQEMLQQATQDKNYGEWDIFKDDVLRVVNKGILSNKPKPKKVIPVPEPEPVINRLLHLDVTKIKQLIALFSPEEQVIFGEELINFSMIEEQTRYCIDQIDSLSTRPNDMYSVHLCSMYKFLLKKRVEMTFNKNRLKNFKPKEMLPHFERFMRRVYDGIVSDIRVELTKQRISRAIEEGNDLSLATTEADKLMSITKMKEKKVSAEKEATIEKDGRIVEYVKYLIGQTQNNDYVLNREEFKQTHELNTKSLSLNFDKYATKEDNAMKRVANDILEKLEMNIVMRENTMPIAALKYANDPKFNYFMSIKSQMSLALPLLAKVVNKQLSLHNYFLGTAHCVAFGETCKQNSTFMSKLVLSNNGLTDSDLAVLLRGMHNMETLSVIDLRKNIVGEQSVRAMADFFVRPFPNHLQALRIVDCKMSATTTYMLLRLLSQKSNLRALSIVGAEFNARNELALIEFLDINQSLRDLDLSWNNMSQKAFIRILECIVENSKLLSLNLSHNTLIVNPKSSTKTAEAQAINNDKMAKFQKMQKEEEALKHQLRFNNVYNETKRAELAYRSLSGTSGRSSRSRGSMAGDTIQIEMVESQRPPSQQARGKMMSLPLDVRKSAVVDQGGFLAVHKSVSRDSLMSAHSESRMSYREDINEKKAKRIHEANKHVSDSSQLNQIITHMICQVTRENRKLQHLDLSSTNLPSQVIVYICDRLRKSRSILAAHFTDNPGLQNPELTKTIHTLMKCKGPEEEKVKIDINKETDYAFDTHMVERLQNQLANEKIEEGGESFMARDTILIRQVMQQKRIEQKAIDFPKDPESNPLVISRVIGFKEQIPGSGQWKLSTQLTDPCWHCDQWIYSLIFWDAQTIGRNAKKNTHYKVLNQIVKKVESLNPETQDPSLVSLSIYDENSNSSESIQVEPPKGKKSPNPFKRLEESSGRTEKNDPVLYGDFTNWKGVKMIPIDDFVMMLAKKYGRQNQDMTEGFPEMLAYMRKCLLKQQRGNTRGSNSSLHAYVSPPSNDVRTYKDLSEEQQHYFDELSKQRLKRILEDWKGLLEQYLEYRKPFLVDAYHLDKPQYQGRCKNLYVYPCFLPAGKHTYLVKNKLTYEYTMHTMVADFRTEDPPVLLKELRHKTMHRVFRKENSVFEPWKEDTDVSLQLAFDADIGNGKLSAKVVKDPFQLTIIFNYIHDNFSYLKQLFLQLSCHSALPNIQQIDILEFIHKMDLIDNALKPAAIDVCFAAVNSRPKPGVIKTGLSRGEFIEFLVRIALIKYKDTEKKASNAVKKLIEEEIRPKFTFFPTWMEFRNRYLWTLDVNDVFQANLVSLQKLYSRNQTIHKTWLEMAEANHMFTQETSLVTEFVFKTCYGFSKMTVIDETTTGVQHYRMQIVEFFELIARVAVAYWEQNKEHLEEVSLASKVEFVLDQLFPLINARRHPVNIDEEEMSHTDDDY